MLFSVLQLLQAALAWAAALQGTSQMQLLMLHLEICQRTHLQLLCMRKRALQLTAHLLLLLQLQNQSRDQFHKALYCWTVRDGQRSKKE